MIEYGLKCPKCECNSIVIETLLSYPAKYDCFCRRCDFRMPFFKRIDPIKIITEEELVKFYNESID